MDTIDRANLLFLHNWPYFFTVYHGSPFVSSDFWHVFVRRSLFSLFRCSLFLALFPLSFDLFNSCQWSVRHQRVLLLRLFWALQEGWDFYCTRCKVDIRKTLQPNQGNSWSLSQALPIYPCSLLLAYPFQLGDFPLHLQGRLRTHSLHLLLQAILSSSSWRWGKCSLVICFRCSYRIRWRNYFLIIHFRCSYRILSLPFVTCSTFQLKVITFFWMRR